MRDCVALGELLIDFTNNGMSSQNNPLFEANPGGAPCNVLAMLSKLGYKTAFIGKVGDDIFGHRLAKTIEEVGIDSEYLMFDKDVRTTLAFVDNNEDGDRTFSFYRNPGADMMLKESDVRRDMFEAVSLFHFGTLSMTNDDCRLATHKAVNYAKEAGAVISLDPNIRFMLWKSKDEVRERVKQAIGYCDILKISDDEISFITGEDNLDKAADILLSEYDIPLMCLTMGKNGSKAFYKGMKIEKEGFAQKNVIDTTGAGDTFCGCMLSYVLKYGLNNLTQDSIEDMLTFANAAASIVTTKRGAIRSMPTDVDIRNCIEARR